MLKLFVLGFLVAGLTASPVADLLENLEDERELLQEEIETLEETQQKREIATPFKTKYSKTCSNYLIDDVFGSQSENNCPSGFVRKDLIYENRSFFRIRYQNPKNNTWHLEQRFLYRDNDSDFFASYGKQMNDTTSYKIWLYCNPAKCSKIAVKKLCFLSYGVYNMSLDNIAYNKDNSEDKTCLDAKTEAKKNGCVADDKVTMNLSTGTPCNFNCAFFDSYKKKESIYLSTEPATKTSYLQSVTGTACVKLV